MHTVHLPAASHGGFGMGLLVGVLLGLLAAPLLRAWVAWRAWTHASREAELSARIVARLAPDHDGDPLSPEGRAPSVAPRGGPPPPPEGGPGRPEAYPGRTASA
jgi:hypothetical protein